MAGAKYISEATANDVNFPSLRVFVPVRNRDVVHDEMVSGRIKKSNRP